jgi:hypothetical protein
MQQEFGKTLLVLGIALAVLGAWLAWGKGMPFLGRLPGDIRIERPGMSFYFPIVTCLVLSAIVSLLLSIFRR